MSKKDKDVTSLKYNKEQGMVLAIMISEIRRRSAKLNKAKRYQDLPKSEKSFVQTYTVLKGIKKFGKKALDASLKEMQQLHERVAFEPISIKNMTPQERKRAMESLIFLVEKRNIENPDKKEIKARQCVNESTQRAYMSREEASSPASTIESVFITSAIDAKERREVATLDVPNAFIQTSLNYKTTDERIIMKVRGVIVDLLLMIDAETYGKHIVYKNGKKVIYLVVLKALYGMLHSALLFYNMFRSNLEKEGFVFNPYDPCVANKDIKGKQLTVLFHVDDVKVSSVRKQSVDDFIQWIDYKYGGSGKPISVTRGKKHDYLGMLLDFTEDGVVAVDMVYYVENMLEDFPIKFKHTETVVTPSN